MISKKAPKLQTLISQLLIVILPILFFIVNFSIANAAQFFVRVSTPIETDQYPTFSTSIKVMLNGTPIVINEKNLVILEDNRTTIPIEVSLPNAQGFQTVKWFTVVRGYSYTYGGGIKPNIVYFLVNKDGNIGLGQSSYQSSNMSQVRFTNDGSMIKDLYFSTITGGKIDQKRANVKAVSAILSNGNELSIHIDSLILDSKIFSYKWYGNILSESPPPVNIYSGFEYATFIDFKPLNNDFVREKMTVYYEGGLKENLYLWANSFPVPTSPYLKLLYPNGRDTLFPCEKIDIKWTGHLQVMPVIVEYTTNGGTSWQPINSVNDSLCSWSVPNVSTDNARIRVRQQYAPTFMRTLLVDPAHPVQKVGYSTDGYKVLSINDTLNITEWDIQTYVKIRSYSFKGINDQQGGLIPYGVEYCGDNNSKIVTAFAKYSSAYIQDTIAFFNVGEDDPYLKVPVDPDFQTKTMQIDATKKYIVLEPSLDTKLMLYSADDGSFIKTIECGEAISAFTFNPVLNTAAVAFYNGDIKTYSIPDFTQIDSLHFSDITYIQAVGLSANGKYLAFACKPPEPNILESNRTQANVYDFKSKQIFRTLRRTGSDAVKIAFSPSSTVLFLGSVGQPQILMWDMVTDSALDALGAGISALTDFRLSPEGHSITTSTISDATLTTRFFSYPETDLSDTLFSITQQQIAIENVSVEPQFIGTNTTFSQKRCFTNTGKVPVIISSISLFNDFHYKLAYGNLPDTVKPGEVFTLDVIFVPIDTGKITDSIVLNTCTEKFFIPISGVSKNRNVSFFNNPYDFGDLCIGDTINKTVLFLKNNDPVALKINSISLESGDKVFSIALVKDTILAPGETLTISAEFFPGQGGIINPKY